MNYGSRLELSYYKEIATINESHRIYLVQHIETHKIYIKKILSVYNLDVYNQLMDSPIPGIPKIFCLFEDNNELTIIEEYLAGSTLEEKLAGGNALPVETVTKYVIELCDILNNLHSYNPPIIHRDIKPSNVIILPGDHIALIDMNAAKCGSEKEEDTVLLGTQGYAAPEQYGFGSSNTQTDIYAMGMLINSMLLGRFSKTLSTNQQYSSIIEQCTKINPKERYKSIIELKQAVIATAYDESKSVSEAYPAKNSSQRFLPPGFRTNNLLHMIVATPSYIFLVWLCSVIQITNVSGFTLWYERFVIFLIFISVIACCTNYLDIQKIMPLCSSQKLWLKFIGIILLSAILVLLIIVILLFLESFFVSSSISQ